MADAPPSTSSSDPCKDQAHAGAARALSWPVPGEAASATGTARREARTDVACRALDLVVGVLVSIVLAPLMLAIAIAIKLDSRGPVLFRQTRVGRHQQPFTVAKFRTMHHGADHEVHRHHMMRLIQGNAPAPKLAADDRVTRLGRVLRRTSLDELPQLWDVLRGDMSLVGPRPPIPYEVSSYPSHWSARFAVKPGITGLWQVNGRSQVSLAEMVRMDVEYAQRRSLRLNLWILLRTVPTVLRTRGAG
jgi:lipopolysaccharide/colanic/teichoic acid biosynthesis glycosyltransferase